MKRIIIILLCLWSIAHAQPGYQNSNNGLRVLRLTGDAFNLPAVGTPAFKSQQWVQAGAMVYDSTGGNRGVYVWTGAAWIKLIDSLSLSTGLISGSGTTFSTNTFNIGGTFSSNTSIEGARKTFTVANLSTLTLGNSTSKTIDIRNSQNRGIYIDSTAAGGSVVIYIPNAAQGLRINALIGQHNSDDSMMVYRTSDNSIGMRPIPSGGGGGSTNTPVGTGFDIALGATNNVKRAAAGNGILIDSATSNTVTYKADTGIVRTVANSYNLQTGQAQKNTYGTLVNTTSFASLSGYTQNGGTWTVASGHVTPSGSSNDYTKSLDFNLYTAVKKWRMISLIVPTAVTGNGGAIGKRGTYTSVYAWFNNSDSTLRIQSSTGTTLATSSKLSYAANDTLQLYFERLESNIYAYIRNVTTKAIPVRCEYRYEMAIGATLMDGMGTASMFTRGDNFNFVSFSYSSDEVTHADLLVLGTSKEDYEYVTTQAYGYLSQLRSRNNMDVVSLASSSSQSKDWTPLRQELLALMPKKLYIAPTPNDLRAGVSTTVTHNNIQAIFNTADSAGIDTYLGEEDYEVGQDNSAWNSYLAATFPANKIVHKDYNLLKATGALQGSDGIHDTPYGDSLKYNAIALDGKIIAGTKGRSPFPVSNFDNIVVGEIMIKDNPTPTFSKLFMFGSRDVTYPMLQRNGSIIELKAADNSSFNQDLKYRDGITGGGTYIQGALTNHTGSGMRLEYITGSTTAFISALTDPSTLLPLDIRTSNFTVETVLGFPTITLTANRMAGFATVTAPTAYAHFQPSLTAGPSCRIPTGVAPTTKHEGDLWQATPQLMFVNGGLQPQEIPQIQQSRVSTQFDVTSNTTLANITGLTATLVAGHIYRFEANIYTTSNSGGGVKFAIAGTATATSVIYDGLTTDAGLTTQGRGTSMAATVGAVTSVTAAYFRVTGTIVVNAGGTITLQFAQNASNGTASSVLVGSTFIITEMP